MFPTATSASEKNSPPERLASLDQFRGYTVAGMFLVNFVGGYAAIAAFLPTLHHWHTHCSYADTIMPQFLFAVGFGFRMSYLKRRETSSAAVANWRVVRRIFGLLLVALIVHHLDGKFAEFKGVKELGVGGFLTSAFQRNYFQTLAHIGVTSLWVVPVIGAGVLIRMGYATMSCVLFVFLSTYWYYDWELTRPGIDGGPLGFLTWSAPLLLGTLAYDIWKSDLKRRTLTMFAIGCLVMLLGYGLSCVNTFTFPNKLPEQAKWSDMLAENPFVRPMIPDSQESPPTALSLKEKMINSGADIPKPTGLPMTHWINRRNEVFNQLNASGQLGEAATRQQLETEKWLEPNRRYLNQWTMSQRAGSPSYTLFGAGLGMSLLAIMMLVCDDWGFQLGVFRTLGLNALIGYILHGMVYEAVKPFFPKDSPLVFVLFGFAISFGICYLVLRTLEKQRIIFRL
jgi:predicted acyltransferase